MATRQQIRQQERAWAKRGQAVASSGLAPTPEKQDVLAVTFVLSRKLGEQDNPHRASEAAKLVLGLCEVSMRKAPGAAKLACAKGCGYCCHSWVAATVPEVLNLAGSIREAARSRPGLLDRIGQSAAGLAGLSREQRFGARLPCPLLVDSACSFYRERPVVCRQTTSLELAACIDEFEGRGFGGEIKVSSVYLAHARNSRAPLSAALAICGLDGRTYELSSALVRVLELDDAERRWLAGEDIMAGIARGPEETAFRDAVAAIVREIGGTAQQ